MKTIPDGTAAVLLDNGSVYAPVWPHPDPQRFQKGWWLGTMVDRADLAGGDPRLVGGNYAFKPVQVVQAFSPNAYEVYKLVLAQQRREAASNAPLLEEKP